MGRQVFTAGEILTAANMNDLSDQSVMVFDDATARTTAIPTPVEGMVTYLKDANQVQAFTGSAFTAVGGILQVVSTTKSDAFTATVARAAQTAITGLTASITPSSTSSKVLIFVNVTAGRSDNQAGVFISIFRDATQILLGDTAGSRTRVTGGASGDVTSDEGRFFSVASQGVDLPSSTSSLTYSVQIGHGNLGSGVVYVNRNGFTDTGNTDFRRGVSSITLMEVAG